MIMDLLGIIANCCSSGEGALDGSFVETQYNNSMDQGPTLKSLLDGDFDRYKAMAEYAISIYSSTSEVELCNYFSKKFTETDFYMPKGSIVLELNGRVGNQLFEYAAAYSLAKQTESNLYVLVNPRATDRNEVNYLDAFNIPQEYFLYKNEFNQQYLKLLYPYKEYGSPHITSIDVLNQNFKTTYVNSINFFDVASQKNNQILVMNSLFQSPFFFQSFKDDILEQFKFKNIDSNKFQQTLEKLESKDSVCIHIRRTDANQFFAIFTHIEFYKQAMEVSKVLLDNPKFFIFSDDIEHVKNELNEFHDVEYLQNSPIEDLYLMSRCYNNIISRGTFSWWAASLSNAHNGFVIAPYLTTPGIVYKYYSIHSLQEYKIQADTHYPENWILLDENQQDSEEKKFNLYTGSKHKLDLCIGNGDFRANLCHSTSNEGGSNREIEVYSGNKNKLDFCKIGFRPNFCKA